MLRWSAKFQDYNYKQYCLRRVREGFRANRNASGEELTAVLGKAREQAALIERQASVSSLFPTGVDHVTSGFSQAL